MERKPTIEEIEAILEGGEVDIEILPTGEIKEKNTSDLEWINCVYEELLEWSRKLIKR